jgi:hypothetical protein
VERESSKQKRLVTRYATQSAEAADENQRRVEGVFAELDEAMPGNVSYIVLRLADDSFLHVSFHDHGDDEVNPIASTAAFAHFKTTTPIAERVASTSRPQVWSAPTSRRSTRAGRRLGGLARRPSRMRTWARHWV